MVRNDDVIFKVSWIVFRLSIYRCVPGTEPPTQTHGRSSNVFSHTPKTTTDNRRRTTPECVKVTAVYDPIHICIYIVVVSVWMLVEVEKERE